MNTSCFDITNAKSLGFFWFFEVLLLLVLFAVCWGASCGFWMTSLSSWFHSLLLHLCEFSDLSSGHHKGAAHIFTFSSISVFLNYISTPMFPDFDLIILSHNTVFWLLAKHSTAYTWLWWTLQYPLIL